MKKISFYSLVGCVCLSIFACTLFKRNNRRNPRRVPYVLNL
jgi:hypothetical protein